VLPWSCCGERTHDGGADLRSRERREGDGVLLWWCIFRQVVEVSCGGGTMTAGVGM